MIEANEDAPPIGEDWIEMTEVQRAFWISQEQGVFSHFST
jgi:hypothetical protein